MGTIVAALAVLAGGVFLAGLALSDWGTGNKKLSQIRSSQQVQLPEYYEDLYLFLVECVEVEWQERQNGQEL